MNREQIIEALDVAQAEIRSCHKQLGYIGSSALTAVDKAYEALNQPPQLEGLREEYEKTFTLGGTGFEFNNDCRPNDIFNWFAQRMSLQQCFDACDFRKKFAEKFTYFQEGSVVRMEIAAADIIEWSIDYMQNFSPVERMSLQGAGMQGVENRLIKFNLNDHIYIKLKHAGLVHWARKFNQYMPIDMKQPLSYFKSKINKDGYVEFQAHSFIEIFGETMNGSPNAEYFHPTVLLNSNELIEQLNESPPIAEGEQLTDIRDQVFETHGVDPNATFVLNPVAKQERGVTDEMIFAEAERLFPEGSTPAYPDLPTERQLRFIEGAKWLRDQQGDGWIDVKEQNRQLLYLFRDLYCQNVDISTIDEFISSQTKQEETR